MADIRSEKNNNNRIKVFRVKQVVFGISLSVIKFYFHWLNIFIKLFIQCSESGHRLDRRLRILIIGLLIVE